MFVSCILSHFVFLKPVASAPGKKRKEEEDDGPAVVHKVGKEQRIKDEKSLKVFC